MLCGRRELNATCLWPVTQLSALTRLVVCPTQLNDQLLVRVTDACDCLQRLVLVEDRYSEYVCRRAAERKQVCSTIQAFIQSSWVVERSGVTADS